MKKYKTKFDMSFPLNDENVFCDIEKVKNKKMVETRKKEVVPVFHLKNGSIVLVESNDDGFFKVIYAENIYKVHDWDFVKRNLIFIS